MFCKTNFKFTVRNAFHHGGNYREQSVHTHEQLLTVLDNCTRGGQLAITCYWSTAVRNY